MAKYNKNKYSSSDILIGIFLFIVVVVIPLAVKLSVVPLRTDEINAIRTGTGANDVFSHIKSILIMCMGVVTALFLLFELFGNSDMKIDIKSMPVVCAGIFAILAIVSTIFSKHISVALLGATERYEGLFVWLCYIIFFISAMVYSSVEKRAKILLWVFILSGLFLGIIGLLQVLNVPIYNTEFISKLVMGDKYNGTPLSIKFDSVFATLYNPNCAGMYFGMMASLFTVMAVLLPKNSKLKYASMVIAVLTIISTVGSASVGGFLGLACGIGFTIVVTLCYFIFKKKSKLTTIGSIFAIVIVIIAGVLFINSDLATAQKIRIIVDTVANGKTLESSDNYYKDITIDSNKGSLITADGTYSIEADKENSKLLHNDTVLEPLAISPMENGNGTQYTYREGGIKWDLYCYQTTRADNVSYFNLTLISTDNLRNERIFMFSQNDNGSVSFLDKFGYPVDTDAEIPRFGFEGIERLGSNRGYIWSRSIPLLTDNIIIGAGPDTFEFEFPQNDVISKLNYLNDPYVILDKPHNMFLQYAINTGCLSLIVLLVLFIGYIVQTIKEVFNDSNKFNMAVRLGICAGIIAYLAAGLTTDSVVSVAPVFWIMLGMGYGVNLFGKKIMSLEDRKLEKLRKKIK